MKIARFGANCLAIGIDAVAVHRLPNETVQKQLLDDFDLLDDYQHEHGTERWGDE
jgi:hypothetical protein